MSHAGLHCWRLAKAAKDQRNVLLISSRYCYACGHVILTQNFILYHALSTQRLNQETPVQEGLAGGIRHPLYCS